MANYERSKSNYNSLMSSCRQYNTQFLKWVCAFGNTRTPNPQTRAPNSKLTCFQWRFFACTHLSKVLIVSLARGEIAWWGGGGGRVEVVESPARLWKTAGAPPNAGSSMGTTHAVCCNFSSKPERRARLSVSPLSFPTLFYSQRAVSHDLQSEKGRPNGSRSCRKEGFHPHSHTATQRHTLVSKYTALCTVVNSNELLESLQIKERETTKSQ